MKRAYLISVAAAFAASAAVAGTVTKPERGTVAKPDYSSVRFKGRGNTHDSFSLVVQAAADLLGKKADYRTVYMLSTNSFAPDVRPDEECRSTWMTRGRGQCLDLVAAAVGLKVRPVGAFAKREYGAGPPAPETRKAAYAAIREALDSGEVVITDSGWNESFSLWGIVTDVNLDGSIEGMNPASSRNSLDHVCSFWALSAGEPSIPPEEADMEVLRRAVARIRGKSPWFAADSLVFGQPAVGAPAVPGAVVWGKKAMDLWIDQMRKPSFQEDDPGSSAGNARLCALMTMTGAKASAEYLRRLSRRFSGASKVHLSEAAAGYERAAGLLKPYAAPANGNPYREVMKSPKEMREHGELRLAEVRDAIDSAGVLMENALTAARYKGTVVLNEKMAGTFVKTAMEGMEKYWGIRSYVLAHLAYMRALGKKSASWEDVSTLSGFGPSFAYDHEKYWVGYFAPPGCDERIARATGFGFKWQKSETTDEAWEIVKARLDEGMPLRTPWYEEAVISGYMDSGVREERRIYVQSLPFDWPGRWWTWADFEKWHSETASGGGMLCWHSGRVAKQAAKETAVEALRLVVELAREDPRAKQEWLLPNRFGLDGIKGYAEDVGDPDKSGKPDQGYFSAGWLGCHAIYGQWVCRQLTGAYLKKAAKLFPGAAGGHVARAARCYEDARADWHEWEKSLGRAGMREAPANAWEIPEHRKTGALAIQKALEHERTAVEEIEKALAVL